MQSYDISYLPQPVHDAVLHLMQMLVEAFPPPTEGVTEAAAMVPASPQRYRQGTATLPAVPVLEQPALPTPVRCPHGTHEAPCCAACTTLYRAEAVLAEVQTTEPQRFPRRPVELQILEALQQMAPLPVTPRQVAAMLGLPPEQVRLLLQALATLGTVDHPAMGYYRHTPPAPPARAPEVLPRDAPVPCAVIEASTPPQGDARLETPHRTDPLWQREALEQQALAIVRAAFPRPMSPSELREPLGSGQARAVLKTLVSRGQVEWVGHGRYRYRAME